MFYYFFVVWGVITLTAVEGSLQCQQKEVPNNVLTSFNNSVPNLETGQLKVYFSNTNNRYNQFDVTLSRAISNYRLASAIKNIFSFSPKNGLDFKISAVPYATRFVGYVVMDVQAIWGSVALSYAASGRNDFIVGSFTVENNLLIDPSFNNTSVSVVRTISVPDNLSQNHYFTMPFINGLRTYDESLTLAFTTSTFNSTSKQLNFTIKIQYQVFPLEFLSVSYLIFHMAAELQISRVFDLLNIPNTIDTFLGVSNVATSPSLFEKNTNISNSTRPLLQSSPVTVEAFSQMFGVNGIMVQTQQTLDLLFLPVTNQTTTLSCISKTTCEQYHGQMVYQQIGIYDIESKCQICVQNSAVNHTTGLCQCVRGYTMINSTCIKLADSCSANQVYSSKVSQCVCAKLYVNISGICISIMSLCGPHQIYYQGQCIQVVFSSNASPCPRGYLMINGVCQKKKICSFGQNLNTTTNQCECRSGTGLLYEICQNCGPNSTIVSGVCQCYDKYYRINGTCKMCGRYAFFNGQTCVCSRNYEGDGFTCTESSNLQSQLASPLSGAFTPGGAVAISNNV